MKKSIKRLLKDTADSIRLKDGTCELMPAKDFPERIYGITDPYPPYSGPYKVSPKTTQQDLKVKDMRMKEDLSVLPIPFYEVTNVTGGLTVYIGE